MASSESKIDDMLSRQMEIKTKLDMFYAHWQEQLARNDKRFEKLESRADALDKFKWVLIGIASAISTAVSWVIHLVGG